MRSALLPSPTAIPLTGLIAPRTRKDRRTEGLARVLDRMAEVSRGHIR